MNSSLPNPKIKKIFPMEMEQKDLKELEKAKRKLIIFPLMAFGITYLIKNFRDKMFVSNNFLVNMMTIRGKYSDTQYKSKTFDERKEEINDISDPYKQIKGIKKCI